MATRSFSFRIEQPGPRHCVIRMAGEFGPRSVPNLQAFLARRLDARPTRLVLDFSAVTSLSSQALAVLLAAKRRADAQGVRLYLVATDEAGAARMLDVTGLARMFRAGAGQAPADRIAVSADGG
jgi:anti-anti-sigma factor